MKSRPLNTSQSVPPILMPCCIHPSDRHVKLDNPMLRLYHLLEGVANWLSINPKLKIVLCDGSNFDLGPIIAEKFPYSDIECLFFQNSKQKVFEKGKGYGEGEIIAYALLHSRYLEGSDSFVKCTGKLWVKNFTKCVEEWNSIFMACAHFSNILNFRKTKLEYIDTRFYVTTKEFYGKNLADAHLETSLSTSNKSLEHIFLKRVLNTNLKNFIFYNSPIICGTGGGSGKPYKNSPARILKKKLKMRLLAKDPELSELIYNA